MFFYYSMFYYREVQGVLQLTGVSFLRLTKECTEDMSTRSYGHSGIILQTGSRINRTYGALGHCTAMGYSSASLVGRRSRRLLIGSGRSLPKTDIQPADEIGLAASQLLLIRWHADPQDETSLFAAVACLRYITSKSPSCLQAHVLLIRLFRILGM